MAGTPFSMREYNLAPFVDRESKKEDFLGKVRALLRYGWSWYQEYKAQEAFLDLLRPLLNRQFIAIRNYVWPELDYPFPIILIGPPGVYLLYVTPMSGEFRIRGENLYRLGGGKRSVDRRPIQPNLVQRTHLMGEALRRFIAQRLGLDIPVHKRLVFIRPDVYVDAMDSPVQPLLADGIRRFAEQLLKAPPKLNRLQIRELANLFLEEVKEREEPAQGQQTRAQILADVRAGLKGAAGTRARQAQRAQAMRAGQQTRRRSDLILGLTLQQWLIVGALLFLNIVVLIVGLVLIARLGG
ncbi:MAG: hypothetical protein GXO54_02710 [Chloroflexi bacterium]|nr:hypothetical protein [Chloroflexota bacterium]